MTKPTKWHVHPAKTQISLGIHPVWSEASLTAWRNTGSSATNWAHCEDSNPPRLIWVFAGRTGHFVGFVVMRLIWILPGLCVIQHSMVLTRTPKSFIPSANPSLTANTASRGVNPPTQTANSGSSQVFANKWGLYRTSVYLIFCLPQSSHNSYAILFSAALFPLKEANHFKLYVEK